MCETIRPGGGPCRRKTSKKQKRPADCRPAPPTKGPPGPTRTQPAPFHKKVRKPCCSKVFAWGERGGGEGPEPPPSKREKSTTCVMAGGLRLFGGPKKKKPTVGSEDPPTLRRVTPCHPRSTGAPWPVNLLHHKRLLLAVKVTSQPQKRAPACPIRKIQNKKKIEGTPGAAALTG